MFLLSTVWVLRGLRLDVQGARVCARGEVGESAARQVDVELHGVVVGPAKRADDGEKIRQLNSRSSTTESSRIGEGLEGATVVGNLKCRRGNVEACIGQRRRRVVEVG